jgi:WD40 repeat protein/DNA-binding SARP family transcriptional activator
MAGRSAPSPGIASSSGMLEIRVLGPLEASANGHRLALGGGKPRAVLAMLALRSGETVSTDRLIDGLWGGRPPATAVKLVQLYVSRLRKMLAAGGNGAVIVTRGRGYELRAGAGAVDAVRFERLVSEGAAREALALWRGPALDDVADEPFAAGEIRRLEELRLAAVELAVDSDLEAGRHRRLVAELDELVAEHPLREKLHAQRMLALYRCGRQAEALEAYRGARAKLVEEIGVEPGPELRRLHEAILRQDPSLELSERDGGELPPELDRRTPLVGRDEELGRLSEHWRLAGGGTGRLVLVTGSKGMGKTRLAAELAGKVHGGGGAVLYASGRELVEAARSALDEVRAAPRRTLLVLEDVDRLVSEERSALARLCEALDALPMLVLATAEDTEPARLRAHTVITLAPLDAAGVAAVAGRYAPGDVEVPVAPLAEESGGVPLLVHRAADKWAREQAERRLADAAGNAAAERARLRAAEDELAGSVVELQGVRERAGQGSVPAPVVCPFKGLASFDVEDAEVFFGREHLVAEMVARLAGAPLVGVVGPSGSGKSSALKAGLLAALAAGVLPGSERWSLTLLRPGEHPVRALQRAMADAVPGGRRVVAVDQFEEVFTACRDESERAAFVDALLAATRDPGLRALVLVAVRADFYGRCAAYPELSRLLGANHVLVGSMRRDELRRAIELPARQAALQVEAALVDRMIADVEGEPGALPLLSTALLELWQHRDDRRLRLSTYEQLGGVHGAVPRLAESAYARLDPERREVARRILLRLAGEVEGDAVVRRRVELAELEAENDERVAEVLTTLAADRLVTIGEGEVEVAHEALLREWPRLRGWLEEDSHGRRLHQHLRTAARDWDAAGRDPGELYRGARLAGALEWSAAHEPELNASERAFLKDSRRAGERSQRRLRAVLAGIAALLVLAVVAGVVALQQRGSAREQAVAADAQRLGASALVEDDLSRALLLARQGVAIDDSVQTRGNLLAALLESPAALGVLPSDGEPFVTIELSPDERTLAAGTNSNTIFLFDTRTRRRLAKLEPTSGYALIADLAFSRDGRGLAVGYDSPSGAAFAVFDVRTGRVVARLPSQEGRFIGGLGYSPDGQTVDVVLSRTTFGTGPAVLMRFDAQTGEPLFGPAPINNGGTTSLMITSDGRRLVAVGDGETVVRDARDLRVLARWPVGGRDVSQFWPTALAPDDRTVAIGGADGSLRLLDLDTGEQRTALGRHVAEVFGARFTPDGRTLVTTGAGGDVILWDVGRATARETLHGEAGRVLSPQITSDGSTLYTAGPGAAVFIWDLAGTRRLGHPFSTGPDDSEGWEFEASASASLALSSDGRLIASGRGDGAISVVNGQTLTPRNTFAAVTTGAVNGLAFVPGSHLLVVSGPEGFVALVDADRGRVLRRLPGHAAGVLPPAIGADGRLLVTGSDDGTVRLWSLPAARALGDVPLRSRRAISDVQVSPDGRTMTVVLGSIYDSRRGTLEVWDVRDGRRVIRLDVPDTPTAVSFSPDGRLLAVGYLHGRSQLWSTTTWKPVSRLLVGDVGEIYALAISPDGRTLATGSQDRTVRLWDIETQQAIGAPLPGPGRGVGPVAPYFTPDGSRLIAAYDTGVAYRWDIRPESLVRHACQVAGRALTRAEWEEFLPGRDYDPAC